MADIRKLTDQISVAAQLVVDDIDEIKASGFQSVLCNRPDQEEAGQPGYREVSDAINEHGMVSEFQPVNGSMINDDDVDAFAAHLNELSGPVLAYCRTGTRCTVLWALSQAGKRSTDEILAIARSAGYSLEPLTERLQARAASADRS